MSERAISDPTEHGWVDAGGGKWMWGGSGGGSGSPIQDGDTEGQITTWDGTEWTPEGAVVVADGNVAVSNSLDVQDRIRLHRQSGDLSLPVMRYWDGNGNPLTGQDNLGDNLAIGNSGGGNVFICTDSTPRIEIDSTGNVNIVGKLFINGEEVTAGGGGSTYTAGNGITIDGDTIKMSGSYSGTFTANVLKGTS